MSPKMIRWSGWILLLGAAISIVGDVLQFVIPGPAGLSGPSSNVVTVINLIAGIVILLGLPAVYVAHSKQLGTLGLIGCIALWLTGFLFDIVLGIISIVVVSSSNAAALAGPPPPPLFALFIVGTLLELVAGVLLGLRIIQTRVYPSLIGWLLIVSAVLSVVDFPLQGMVSAVVATISTLLLFVALGWLGYSIASQTAEAATQAAD